MSLKCAGGFALVQVFQAHLAMNLQLMEKLLPTVKHTWLRVMIEVCSAASKRLVQIALVYDQTTPA